MKLKLQSLTTTGLQCAAVFTIVFRLDLSTTAKISLGLTLLIFATFTGSLASTFALIFGSLSLLAVAQIAIEQIFGVTTLSLGVHTSLILLLSLIGVAVFRDHFLNHRWQIRTSAIEFISIAVSVFLFRELSISGGERYLAMLRPEDNIPWMGASQRLLSTNVITGFTHDGGGHAFGHVLALIAHLQNLGSTEIDISRSFATVGIAYQLTGIISLLFMARISIQFVDLKSKSGVGVAIATQVLIFRLLLPLITSEGHLSLYLAICFGLVTLWNLGNARTPQSTNKYWLLTVFNALLIGGAWWPLMPISMTTIAGVVLVNTKLKLHHTAKHKVAGLGIALTFGILVIIRTYKPFFTEMDLRGFLNAGGSFTESPPLMTGLAITSVLIMYIAARREMSSTSSSGKLLQCIFLSTFLGYGIFLSQATYFVGPTFSASNYSAGKLLYGAVVVTIPFFVLNVVGPLKKKYGANVGVSALAIVGMCGAIFFANNLVNGRINTITPAWSKTFISLVNQYPTALIVCNSDQDLEAYNCTKTARYVMQNVIDSGQFRYRWENLQLFPVPNATLTDAYEKTILANPKTQVFVISLEPTLTAQEIDRSWMEPLPWNMFTVVNAADGGIIPEPLMGD